MLLTAGTVADGTQALALIEGIPAEYLLADKSLPRTRYGGYDTNGIVAQATELGMQVVIPSRRNRREPREYDRHWYRLRHLVENGFCDFKSAGGGRGVATRYARKASSFLANCQIRAIAIWAKII